jgi:lipoyl-dependent peroxiredoxin
VAPWSRGPEHGTRAAVTAVWNGTLKEGNGTLSAESGHLEGPYTFASRFENGSGTNPDELIGAAEAGCFSMAFSLELEQAGYKAERIQTNAAVTIELSHGGFAITGIKLTTNAKVPGIPKDEFDKIAEGARANAAAGLGS